MKTTFYSGLLLLILLTSAGYALKNVISDKAVSGVVGENTSVLPPVDEIAGRQTVKVFFNNTKFDPGLMDCSNVYPVDRKIDSTLAVGRAALDELLRGLVPGESEKGYITNLNTGITIQKLTIENGVAKVDFSEQLQAGVGGSCKTLAIRSQITQTLKQFPTVKEVVISIDGNVEDILQP